jgi:hypothetical protein
MQIKKASVNPSRKPEGEFLKIRVGPSDGSGLDFIHFPPLQMSWLSLRTRLEPLLIPGGPRDTGRFPIFLNPKTLIFQVDLFK